MNGAEWTLVAVHLAATAAMAGLIWFVQLVHYPLFAAVGREGFVAYEAAHMKRTSWVVGPLMGIEGVAALAIAALVRNEVGLALTIAGLVLLAVIHASTVFFQVPAHTKLAREYDDATQQRLVRTNWVRTIGWSARTAVATAMVVNAG